VGAHTCSHVVCAKTWTEAVKKAEDYQAAERHENGHGPYTGHLGTAGIGVVKCDRKFASDIEAAEWIFENHHDKWSLPMLARCGEDRWILAGWCAS
jgi:hypothetical protein